MSVEAFLWAFQEGDVTSLPLDKILATFADFTVGWQPADGVLRVCFGDEVNCCEIYCGSGSEASNSTKGLIIFRPVEHHDLWRSVLAIMRLGNVVLFFSDDTTPLFAIQDAPRHLPADLLESLGQPRFVECPDDILRKTPKRSL
jgi:hypothetical protein